MLDGEGRGHADTLVVRENVGLSDVQEIQNALKVASRSRSTVVSIGGDAGITGASVVRCNNRVVLGENGTNELPRQAVLRVSVNKQNRWARTSVSEVDADIVQGNTAMFPGVKVVDRSQGQWEGESGKRKLKSSHLEVGVGVECEMTLLRLPKPLDGMRPLL